jgi:tetratricopeptide (TPR) repeat protein
MIVKDEERNLRECLEAVGDAVDEVVIVDTGSRDRTCEVATELGARVFPFQWIDDFSAARNFSIDQAKGKYILWMDADDRLPPSEKEKLKAQKQALSKNDGNEAYYFRVINEDESGQKGEFLQLRLFPNIPGARFEGQVHEQIYHILQGLGVRLSKLDIIIDHMGYDDAEAKREKAQRNLSILTGDLQKAPGNPYLHFHIANTYSVLGEHAKSIEHYERIRAIPDLEERYPGALSRVLLETAASHHKMGNTQRAQEVMLEHNACFPESWIGKFILAELYIEQGRWEEAKGLLCNVSEQEITADIFPLPLEEIRFKLPWYLGQCHEGLGDLQQALNDFEQALVHCPQNPEALARSGRLCLMLGDVDGAIRYCEKAASLDRGNAEVLCNLGVAYKRAGRLGDALNRYVQALEVDPNHIDTRTNLGYLLLQMGRLKEAHTQFIEILKYPGEWLDIRLALAQVYWSANDLDAFISLLDEILQILHLNRNRELQHLDDLIALLEEIKMTLHGQNKEKEAALASQCIQRIREEIARAKERMAAGS